jgi:hypothetical protein
MKEKWFEPIHFKQIKLKSGLNEVKRLTLLFILVLVITTASSLTLSGCSAGGSSTTIQAFVSTEVTSTIKEIKWNLSGAVMPKPQFGSRDISGSERASVLRVNQTEKQVQITGDMNYLRGNTSYTVLLAKGYSPKTVFPGLFTGKIVSFTFMSTQDGLYRWTFIIFNSDFLGPGTYTLSVWIKETITDTAILISDNFDITIK